MNIEKIIKQTFEEVFAENNKISEMPNLDENLVLLESGLDFSWICSVSRQIGRKVGI